MIRDALEARKNQNLPAVLGEKCSISYAELSRQAVNLQALLPQDNTESIAAILLPDGSNFVSSLFAVLQAGWTALPLNVHLTSDEISNLLRQVPARAIITSKSLQSICEIASKACCEAPLVLYVETLPQIYSLPPSIQTVNSNKTMLLMASSGTTGPAKLVKLSETNVDFNVNAYLNHMGYEKYQDPAPRYALGTPLFSIYGLLIYFSCIIKGFPLLPMADGFTLDALYRASQEYGISHYDGGTLAAVLMDKTLGRPIPYDISALRYFGFGGSKAPHDTFKRLASAFPNIRFWSGYGMTEASPLIAQPFQELPFEKLDSVGIPIPGVRVRLETEESRINTPNKLGEIVVQGPNVMLGYYKNEEATQEILKDGWLHTGDIGYFDNDGYLYICGRKKNMILVRGFNVYPEEVEDYLLRCPLVKDCVVYSSGEETGTEIVCADVVASTPEATTKKIQIWCTGNLADYKRPRRINLVDKLKKTSTGKNKRVHKGDSQ